MKPNKDSLEVDRQNMEVERSLLPKKVFIWGEKLAEARAAAKRAKNKLKLTFADIAAEVRLKPDAYCIQGRPTEQITEDCVLRSPAYKKVQEELIQAELEVDILEEYMEALKDKSFAIKDLTELHGQQYWSRALPQGGGEDVMRETARRVKDPIPKERNRGERTR